MATRAIKVVSPRTREERVSYYLGLMFEVIGYIVLVGGILTLGTAAIALLMAVACIMFGRSLRRR